MEKIVETFNNLPDDAKAAVTTGISVAATWATFHYYRRSCRSDDELAREDQEQLIERIKKDSVGRKELNLPRAAIEDKTLEEVSKYAKDLKRLNLGNASNLTPETLKRTLPRLDKLEVLTLVDSNISDDYLKSVLLQLRLSKLELKRCNALTPDVIKNIIEEQEKVSGLTIKEISLGFCENFSEEKLKALKRYLDTKGIKFEEIKASQSKEIVSANEERQQKWWPCSII